MASEIWKWEDRLEERAWKLDGSSVSFSCPGKLRKKPDEEIVGPRDIYMVANSSYM